MIPYFSPFLNKKSVLALYFKWSSFSELHDFTIHILDKASWRTWDPSLMSYFSDYFPVQVWLSTNPYNINNGENAIVNSASYHEANKAIIIPTTNDDMDWIIDPK